MAFNLVDKIKALFGDPTIQEIVDSNRSVNYYRPDWVEPEEQEEDYKKWKKYIDSMYQNYPNITKEFPTEYEFRNNTDPYDVKKNRAAAQTNTLKTRESYEGPNVAWNNNVPYDPIYGRHELFHAKDTGEGSYWDNWSRLSTTGFESYPEFGRRMYRQAQPYAYPSVNPSNSLAVRYSTAFQKDPFNNNLGEELGAYMMEQGKDRIQKPLWMSDRDYQLMLNFINARMGWE